MKGPEKAFPGLCFVTSRIAISLTLSEPADVGGSLYQALSQHLTHHCISLERIPSQITERDTGLRQAEEFGKQSWGATQSDSSALTLRTDCTMLSPTRHNSVLIATFPWGEMSNWRTKVNFVSAF